jgi:hypothetical protein
VLERVLRRLSSTGMRRGVIGGSRAWAVVWLTAFAIRKWGIRREEVVYSESLEPGGRLTITHEQPPAKTRGRRTARR